MYVMRLGCPYTAHVAGHTDILIPQRGYLGAYISVTPGLRVRGRFFIGASLKGRLLKGMGVSPDLQCTETKKRY